MLNPGKNARETDECRQRCLVCTAVEGVEATQDSERPEDGEVPSAGAGGIGTRNKLNLRQKFSVARLPRIHVRQPQDCICLTRADKKKFLVGRTHARAQSSSEWTHRAPRQQLQERPSLQRSHRHHCRKCIQTTRYATLQPNPPLFLDSKRSAS